MLYSSHHRYPRASDFKMLIARSRASIALLRKIDALRAQ
jgi:hypothetical protein